jgi:hypothetical protein|tara:strand:+ start:1879 stop:2097 length:219 start_codon:yes stop_codon:yes gene_type:complete
MSGGFGESSPPLGDDELKLNVNMTEVDKLIKKYKKINKFRKTSFYEVNRLDGKQTYVERLINNYGIDDDAIK